MKLTIPELSLVVLIGPTGAGKSTFAKRHFKPTEIISSDFCRGLVSDDENDQAATNDAFEVLHFIASKRLAAGKLTVIDATNVQAEARKPLVTLARKYHFLPVAVVLNVPEKICLERNKGRDGRDFGPHVIRQQSQQLRRSLRSLKKEGFRHVHILTGEEEIESAEFERQPLWNNLRHVSGPFDIIGDVHGCFDELAELLKKLGYEIKTKKSGRYEVRHPDGRKAVFLGDLTDRGPKILEVLRLVMDMVGSGAAYCVPGNHDMKLVRKLRGKDVSVKYGLEQTLEQLEAAPEETKEEIVNFLDGLVSHYVFDGGKLVVAHAGMKEEMQGRGSGKVRDFALYGETTGETDEFGLRVRYNWAADYRGKAIVVYGHTPVPEPQWLNSTINIDTGCVFGGRLTALRYPEKELISVATARVYYEPIKPLVPAEESSITVQQREDDLLDIEDVTGKRIIETGLQRTVTIREENALAALEVMSRYAVNPKWLIYLPPTMSPPETTSQPDLLEHPAEAFSYYQNQGIAAIVCEEKHMGSRAVIVVCKDEEVARERFGVIGEGIGICYTRTGRRFFEDQALERDFLTRVNAAIGAAGIWNEFDTGWVCLDAELMPWSAKAQELIRQQYAAVGAASRAALFETLTTLKRAASRGLEADELMRRYRDRADMTDGYTAAYRQYCWPVGGIADLKLAPFHILATEGEVHTDMSHVWHMEKIKSVCEAEKELFFATPFKEVDLTDPVSKDEGVKWWERLTGNGGEGMVVKPLDFIAKGRRGLVQPAVKCRAREYLRIIYGPEYTAPENLERLRSRSLATKRSLALREFALGIEALERFVKREPLRRIHECVFGVLALESEPVDPRL